MTTFDLTQPAHSGFGPTTGTDKLKLTMSQERAVTLLSELANRLSDVMQRKEDKVSLTLFGKGGS